MAFRLYVLSCLVTGVIAGRVWQSKGGKYWGGFWYGAGLNVLGLFYVAFAHPPQSLRDPTLGDVVALTSLAKLEKGKLLRGHRSVVLSTDAIDGTPVVEVRGPRTTGWPLQLCARDRHPHFCREQVSSMRGGW